MIESVELNRDAATFAKFYFKYTLLFKPSLLFILACMQWISKRKALLTKSCGIKIHSILPYLVVRIIIGIVSSLIGGSGGMVVMVLTYKTKLLIDK